MLPKPKPSPPDFRPARQKWHMLSVASYGGWVGRLLLTQWQRMTDQLGFAGRLLILAWESRRVRRCTIMSHLILDEVYKLLAGSLVLLGPIGFLLGFLWSSLWLETLSNIGGLDSISSFLVNINTLQVNPIMTTVIVLLRHGAPTTWELAIMKSSRQLETLVRLGIPPEHYLAIPRIVGSFLAVPILLAVFTLSSFLGSFCMAWYITGQTLLEFIFSLSSHADERHFFGMFFKSVIISLTISFFCIYNGFDMKVGDLNRGRILMRRALGEAFFYSIFLCSLVTVFYDRF